MNFIPTLDHPGLLPLLVCKFPLQEGEPWVPTLAIHLIVPFQCACKAASELLSRIPLETTLSTRVQCLRAGPFAVSFTDSVHSQNYLDHLSLPLPPLVILFHRVVI